MYYQVTDLPLGYTAAEQKLTFRVYYNLTLIQCSFLTVTSQEMFHEIHSNFGKVTLKEKSGICYNYTEMLIYYCYNFITEKEFPHALRKCDPVNVTFSFGDEYYVSWDTKYYHPNCKFNISISGCHASDMLCNISINHTASAHVNASLSLCLSPTSDYERGATINIIYDNPHCAEGDRSCRSRQIYLPDAKNATSKPSISMRFYCNSE